MTGQPNFVFLFPDQLRADFVGAYGASFIETPQMDRIAHEGVRYTNAVSASPLCVPARTALMTGMNAMRNGVMGNFHGLRLDYRETGISTLPELLAGAGYTTAAIGKMHFYPWDARLGFQHRVVAEDKRWLEVRDDYHDYLAERGLRKLHGRDHERYEEEQGAVVSPMAVEDSPDQFVARESVRFIEGAATVDQPFFLMVGFPGPHCPYDPVPESLDRIDISGLPDPIPASPFFPALRERNVNANRGAWNGIDYRDHTNEAKRRLRHHYAALVAQVDDAIGLVLDALERTCSLDNTVIILSSDHGDYLGDHGMVGKAGFHEATVRVPLLVRPPGGGEGTTNDELVELRDITATILADAGCDKPGYMDARALPGLGVGDEGRDWVFGCLSLGWMLSDGRFKLHKYITGETALFDLETDPEESSDLSRSREHADTFARLDGMLTTEIMANLDVAFADRAVRGDGPLWTDLSFGGRGWPRRYPEHPEVL